MNAPACRSNNSKWLILSLLKKGRDIERWNLGGVNVLNKQYVKTVPTRRMDLLPKVTWKHAMEISQPK